MFDRARRALRTHGHAAYRILWARRRRSVFIVVGMPLAHLDLHTTPTPYHHIS